MRHARRRVIRTGVFLCPLRRCGRDAVSLRLHGGGLVPFICPVPCLGRGSPRTAGNSSFDTLPVAQQLLNSTLVSGGAVLIILAVSTTGGYAFAKLGYPASSAVFLLILAGMMIPVQSIIITEFVNVEPGRSDQPVPRRSARVRGAGRAVRDLPHDHVFPRRAYGAHGGVDHGRRLVLADLPSE